MAYSIDNKASIIIDKVRVITGVLGTPIFDECYSAEYEVGKSFIIDNLVIECLCNEDGISVYIKANGTMVFSYSSNFNNLIYTHGKWVDLINDIYNKINELKVIDNLHEYIRIINELKVYFFFYIKSGDEAKKDIDDLLAKEGITISKKLIPDQIISTTDAYPVYKNQDMYYVSLDNNRVGMFVDGDHTTVEFIQCFKYGEWVDNFKRIINDYYLPDYLNKKPRVRV